VVQTHNYCHWPFIFPTNGLLGKPKTYSVKTAGRLGSQAEKARMPRQQPKTYNGGTINFKQLAGK
jgi:hypothetical protein